MTGQPPDAGGDVDASSTAAAVPEVAVVVLCYNQAAYLRQCLDSVAAQSIPVQLIIVDDASTDDSQRVIKEWVAEHSIDAQLVLHDTNQGVCRSGNDGARGVRCPYTAFLAADDFWLPHKLAHQLRELRRLPSSFGMLYSDALLCDETGERLPGRFIGQQTRPVRGDRPSGWIFGDLLRGNFIPAPTVLLRSDCFVELGGFDESLAFEDFDFWLRLSRRYQVWYDSVPLAVYRIRRASMVRSTPRIPVLIDTVKVYQNYLALEGPDRQLVMAALSRGYYRLFAAGAPVGPEALWLSLRLKIHWRAAVLLPLSLLGLTPQRYERLMAWATRRFPILGGHYL